MIILEASKEVCIGVCARFWVLGHAGVRGNEMADKLTRNSSVQRFVGPEPFLGGSLCRI